MTKQLRAEITASHPLLLSHLTTSLALSNHLTPIRTSLASLSTSLDRLQTKIHEPHAHLTLLVTRLNLLAQASDLARRAARFVLVARRLETQMERVKAASTTSKDSKDAKSVKDGKGDVPGEGEKERELAKAALSVAELGALSETLTDEAISD